MDEHPDMAVGRSDIDFWQQDSLHRFDAITQYCLAAWKSLMLINGGAIVALFTLIGNVNVHVDGAKLWLAFVSFSLGIVATIVSIIAAYGSQSLYFSNSQSRHTQAQYRSTGRFLAVPEADTSHKRGQVWEAVGLGGVVLGLIAFIAGSAFALYAVLLPTRRSEVRAAVTAEMPQHHSPAGPLMANCTRKLANGLR